MPVATVVAVLAFSALAQLALFAATLWLTLYPRLLAWLFVLAMVGFMPVLTGLGIVERWFAQRPYLTCSAGAAILATVSFLLIDTAYRRWLATDLD